VTLLRPADAVPKAMKKIPLGRSGLEVSKIGMGAWQASSEWGAKDDDVVKAVERSCELGVNLFDTAEAYGNGHSESVLGRAVAKVGRERLVVATKVFGSHLRYDELQKACRASMKRLGVKYIDLYQIHWPDPWEQIPLKHTMRAMEKLYDEGKIRAIGVSNFAVRDLEEASSCLSKAEIASNQIRYNLLERQIEEEVLPYCRRNGIAVLAWSPLGQGALTGKYGPRKLPKESARAQNPLFSKHNIIAASGLVRVLKKIAEDHGKTTAQVALNWLTRDPTVVPIPGARNPGQAEQNAHSVGWRLTAGEATEIERACEQVRLDYFAT
jgi:myo-inositol catabolism protein IolS